MPANEPFIVSFKHSSALSNFTCNACRAFILSLCSATLTSSSFFKLATSATNSSTLPVSPFMDSIVAFRSLIWASESLSIARRLSISFLCIVSSVFVSDSCTSNWFFSAVASTHSTTLASSSYFNLATSATNSFTSSVAPSIDSIVALSSLIWESVSLCIKRRLSFSSLSVFSSALRALDSPHSTTFSSSAYFKLATSATSSLTSPVSPSIDSIVALSSLIWASESLCMLRSDSFSSLSVVRWVFTSVRAASNWFFSAADSPHSAAFASNSYFKFATSAANWFASPASPSIDSIVTRSSSFCSLNVESSAFACVRSWSTWFFSSVDSLHSATFASSSYFKLAISAIKWVASPASPSIDSIDALSSIIWASDSLCMLRSSSFSSLNDVSWSFASDSSFSKRAQVRSYSTALVAVLANVSLTWRFNCLFSSVVVSSSFCNDSTLLFKLIFCSCKRATSTAWLVLSAKFSLLWRFNWKTSSLLPLKSSCSSSHSRCSISFSDLSFFDSFCSSARLDCRDCISSSFFFNSSCKEVTLFWSWSLSLQAAVSSASNKWDSLWGCSFSCCRLETSVLSSATSLLANASWEFNKFSFSSCCKLVCNVVRCFDSKFAIVRS